MVTSKSGNLNCKQLFVNGVMAFCLKKKLSNRVNIKALRLSNLKGQNFKSMCHSNACYLRHTIPLSNLDKKNKIKKNNIL